MPTKKIEDDDGYPRGFDKPCIHPDHSPSNMRVFSPGLYEHNCPRCGKVTLFRVEKSATLYGSPVVINLANLVTY